MSFNLDLHRTTLRLPDRVANGVALEMSVVDAGPSIGDKYSTPTMVFIHGFGGRAAHWEYQLEQFQTDFRVIALDLRGHGYTDAPTEAQGARYDVPELVADIDTALQILRVPQRFTLVCHSFGGALSAYFVNRHPERVSSLVIIASAVQFHLRLAGRLFLRIPPAILTWVREILPYLGFNAAKMYPPAHVIYLQNRNSVANWDGTEYFRAIRIPTLVILGQRDILFSEESYTDVARLIPAAEQVVIPVSAHQVMVERPDAVNRAIERFVQAQADPIALAEARAAQKAERRAARKILEAERPWLKFYDARTPYRIKMPTVPLSRLLESTARRFGKTTALYYLGGKINWSELERLSNRFAHGLIMRRVKPGERVMLCLPNTPQWVIAYYGVLKAGAIAVLLDASSDKQTLLARIAESKSVILITASNRSLELRDIFRDDMPSPSPTPKLRRVVFVSIIDYMGWREKLKFAALHHVQDGHYLPWFRKKDKSRTQEWRFLRFRDVLRNGRFFPPDLTLEVDAPAVIVHTFGTTGPAVPVCLTHRNLAANALQLRHWLPESRPGDERFLAQQPLSFAYGLTGLLHLGVYLGATLILLPGNDLSQMLKAVQRMRPTYFPTTPSMVMQLANMPGVRRYGLASIRVCAVSGSPLPREIREKFEKITRGRLIEAYGLTEASPAVLAMPLAARRPVGVVGLPLPDTEAKIVDLDSGLDLGLDAVGELWVRGPQVFSGYEQERRKEGQSESEHGNRRQPRATRLEADGWLATGDIASMDEDGFFSIIDRKSNMLIRDGQRVFPRQVEEILFEHPAVALAQVNRVIDQAGVVQLQARVTLHHNMKSTQTELRQYCARRLHRSALPDSIMIEQGSV